MISTITDLTVITFAVYHCTHVHSLCFTLHTRVSVTVFSASTAFAESCKGQHAGNPTLGNPRHSIVSIYRGLSEQVVNEKHDVKAS